MTVKLDEYHTAEEIAANTWRIDEAGVANCYLAQGESSALLIDAGCGAGDLRGCVTKLTDRPVIAAVTHRHPDHVGGAWRFGSYYAHRADMKPVYSLMCSPRSCLSILRRAGYGKNTMAKPKHVTVLPMEDGHIFDLGGRRISVVSVPGHTRGSVVFADGAQKLLFTGDDINPDLWMHLPGCTSLEVWCEGAGRIITLMQAGYSAWNGHCGGRQPLEQAMETRRLVLELLEKRKRGEIHSGFGSYPAEKAKTVIRYKI
jgi:hydroxyacylglutathione hydrolase